MTKLIYLYTVIILSLNLSSTNDAKEICELLAEQKAKSKNLTGTTKDKFVTAMKYICRVDRFSFNDYKTDIDNLGIAIDLLDSIDEVENELIEALKLRASKNSYKASVNYNYVDKNAVWEAIYDYTHILDLKDEGEVYLNRGKLYYLVDRYSKACKDLKTATELGLREASNLYDRYECN